ncbi:guanylate kinase [bacterium]|nr:guanylate kinase [bacterium]
MRGEIYILSGSSGVGKGTVLKKFFERNKNFQLSVSCTTRQPRAGEIDGVNYFFITKSEFDTLVKNNSFLEWAEFSGNFYGTKKDYVEKVLDSGKNIILEIDTVGALKVKSILPDVKMIFILPPSMEELEARLRGRNTETEEAIQKRLQSIKLEIENSKLYDYKIINDDIETAVSELEKILCNKTME